MTNGIKGLKSRLPPGAMIGRWLLLAAIGGAPLAIGAIDAVTLCAVTVVLALAVVLLWWQAPPIRARMVATLVLVAGVALTLYTAVQSIPLPVSWLSLIAPKNADIWSRALAPLREVSPQWTPITLDPIATRIEVLRGVAYLLTFVAALRVAHRREGAVVLSLAIIATGTVLAASALLHPAFGAHRVFGLYEPRTWHHPRHIAPLLNPNHLAAYLNVAFFLALGAITATDPPLPRPILGVILFFLGGTQVWVASRAGTMCLVVGAVIFAMLVRAQRRGVADANAKLATASVVVVIAAGAMIVLGGTDDPSRELSSTDVSKFLVLRDVANLLRFHGLFGVGRGAFESSFPAFRTGSGYSVVTHPENIVAQWLAEWGIPIALAAAIALLFALRPRAALARPRIALGAWTALAVLAIHNMADFSSEVPGVAIAGTACAAIVVGGSAGMDPRWKFALWPRRPTIVAVVAGGLAILALALVWPYRSYELIDDKDRAKDAASNALESIPDLHRFAREAILRHPGEPYFPFVVALHAVERRDESALPWLGATLERSPVHGPAHFMLARVLAGSSPAQARLEYRLAVEQAPELLEVSEAEASQLVRGYDDAMELVPAGKAGVPVLQALSSQCAKRLPATALRLDVELSTRDPSLVEPTMRRARDLVDDLEQGPATPWCEGSQRDGCVREALEGVRRAEQLAPRWCEPYELQARVRIVQGDVAGAVEDLAKHAETVNDRLACLKQVVIRAGTSSSQLVQAVLDEMANAGCTEEEECLATVMWVAQVLETRGSTSRALGLYRRAYEKSPEDDELLQRVARLATKIGLHAEAAEDYARMAQRHPSEPQWKNAEVLERKAATGNPSAF